MINLLIKFKLFYLIINQKFSLLMQKLVAYGNLTFKLLYSREEIQAVVERMSQEINSYYESILKQEGQLDLVIACVLKGAFLFYSDLVRKIKFSHTNEFIKCRSYQGMQSTGQLQIQSKLTPKSFKGKHVLIVEDIHDTGHTLKLLVKQLSQFQPKKIDIAVLVKRPDKPVEINLKFCGIDCSNFIIGYGLDLDQQARNLPEIYQKI